MVQLKLTYFQIRARAEPARLMLHFAGIPYEEDFVKFENWFSEKKAQTPFGFIPILEIDGKPLSESWAIYRYVAKLAGLNGKDAVEEAFIDQNSELFRGWFDKIFAYLRVRAGIDPGDKDQLYVDLYVPNTEKVFPVLENQLKKSSSGFFSANLSWVDFVVASFYDDANRAHPELIGNYKVLAEHSQKILGLPQLQDYIKNRTV